MVIVWPEKLTPPGSQQRVVTVHIAAGPLVLGGNFSLNVGATETWSEIKEQLAPLTGAPPDEQRLFVRRWMWWPGWKCDHLTLADQEIQDDLFIELSRFQPPAG